MLAITFSTSRISFASLITSLSSSLRIWNIFHRSFDSSFVFGGVFENTITIFGTLNRIILLLYLLLLADETVLEVVARPLATGHLFLEIHFL